MPAKKASTGAAKPKTAAPPLHGSYKEMVKHAIITLKERNGSSRSKLKQYVLANNKGLESGASFDNMFNKAIKSGVDKGEFAQPKGPSGTVKLAKKEPAAAKPASTTAKKPAAAKTAKAPATKKAPSAKKAAVGAPKKAAPKTATKKAAKPAAAATKTKSTANTGAKRKSKAAAPAVTDEKKVLGKTKSGRVTKGPAKPAKKAAGAPKKAKKTPSSTPAKKSTTPKKSATPAAPAAEA